MKIRFTISPKLPVSYMHLCILKHVENSFDSESTLAFLTKWKHVFLTSVFLFFVFGCNLILATDFEIKTTIERIKQSACTLMKICERSLICLLEYLLQCLLCLLQCLLWCFLIRSHIQHSTFIANCAVTTGEIIAVVLKEGKLATVKIVLMLIVYFMFICFWLGCLFVYLLLLVSFCYISLSH